MIIAVDFDGTIVEDRFPEIGEFLPDAKAVLRILYDQGHTLVLNTCRTGKAEAAAIQFLADADVRFHYFNRNDPTRTAEYGLDSRKVSADLYIDDRNLGGFPGWWTVLKEVV